MKIILLNGPPRCGKDHAARLIRDMLRPTHTVILEKFSYPHKVAFAAMMKRQLDAEGNVEYYEEHKSEIVPELGVSFRQWQIDFSEKYMKPCYGDDIFARLFLGRIAHRIGIANYVCIVSDCGFAIEAEEVIRRVGGANTIVIRLRTPDTSFTGDSRQWVYHSLVYRTEAANDWDIDNTKDEQFTNRLSSIVHRFIGGQ